MRISDWSSDVCSSDLFRQSAVCAHQQGSRADCYGDVDRGRHLGCPRNLREAIVGGSGLRPVGLAPEFPDRGDRHRAFIRSEEHTSELQSLMRTSYAVFCLKKKIHKEEIYTLSTSYYQQQ